VNAAKHHANDFAAMIFRLSLFRYV
jgi:hypothetical protein